MKYTTHELRQETPEWHAYRANTLNASDAGTALGINPFKTRSELVKELATGQTKEIDAGTQRRFDDGHRFERLAMPIAEAIIGEPLSATTVSREIPGLKRRLSASLDGATFGDTENVEHKTLSESLSAALDRGELPEQYPPQMEQGMMVTGATRCLFIASKWDSNDQLIAEKHVWYESNPALRTKIIAAWKQVETDVENYQHQEVITAPVAERPAELPTLDIQIVGNVVASNLAQWRDVVKGRIAAINTNLTTDQEFSDAKAMVKFLDDGEKRIELVKSQVLAQAVDINAVLSAMDEIKETMRSKRLGLDRTVKAREESIKVEIMQAGKDELAKHIASLNKRLGKVQMPAVAADFATAIKGKRNLESMRGAVADLVAAKKIESNEIADKIDANLDRYADIAAGHEFLFRDLSGLLLKDADAFEAIVLQRINQHAESERKRLEAEREKIRIEEERKAAAKVKAEQEEAERKRIAAEREANAKARQAAMPKVTETIDHGDGIKTIVVQEPAAQAPLGVSEGTATPVAAAPTHKGMTGSARLLDRLDDLARQMTEQELSDLCIHAAHILENRKQAA